HYLRFGHFFLSLSHCLCLSFHGFHFLSRLAFRLSGYLLGYLLVYLLNALPLPLLLLRILFSHLYHQDCRLLFSLHSFGTSFYFYLFLYFYLSPVTLSVLLLYYISFHLPENWNRNRCWSWQVVDNNSHFFLQVLNLMDLRQEFHLRLLFLQ